MTWSFGEPVLVTDGDTKALRAHKGVPQDGYAEAASTEAIKVAVGAAADLIESGALGAGNFAVHATGHSNPGGEPEPGWATDHVSLHVSRVAPPVERPGEVVIDSQVEEPAPVEG